MQLLWTKSLAESLANGAGIDSKNIEINLPPKNVSDADFCVPLFRLAKEAGKSPADYASGLISNWDKPEIVADAAVNGGFLNIKLDREVAARQLMEYLAEGEPLRHISMAGQNIVIEHTSINPNASPHVGRARNAMLGDTLVRTFRTLGADVDARYYVNDMGKQIALLAIAVREKGQLPFDEMLDAYIDINKRVEHEPELEATAFEMIRLLENGDQAIKQEFRDVVSTCLSGQGKILSRLGIEFNHYDWESDFVDISKFDEFVSKVEAKHALAPDAEGRTVVDLQKLGFDKEEGRYLVLKRANSSSLYVFRDLLYNKFKAGLDADRTIIVLGEDHKLYYDQLTKLLAVDGEENSEAVFYSYVLLKDGKMSTRKGNVVLLSELIDDLESAAAAKIEENKGGNTADSQQAEETAKAVARAACRFSFLRVSAGANIQFDADNALKFEGDTGPYVQYTAVRAQSVLDKKPDAGFGSLKDMDWSNLEDSEWELVREISKIDTVFKRAADNMETPPLCDYSLQLARAYSRFYTNCQVIGSPQEERRFALTRAAVSGLKKTTHALGIEIPSKM